MNFEEHIAAIEQPWAAFVHAVKAMEQELKGKITLVQNGGMAGMPRYICPRDHCQCTFVPDRIDLFRKAIE